ncbi:MAG: sigma-54-dependent Fis family transcriptional regulator [Betaproteobacteria bacterium]|nr:sigma-54-dependent Fis family transcriptional regulator [Betaproteobacteria bacterium]
MLIVDDDPLITDTLGYFLGRDYAVTAASTRAEAVGLLRDGKHAPALALIDLGLPPTPHRPNEGFSLIADILAHAPETRIIVLSGQSDELNARHARALGATEFVVKPADPEYLRKLIGRVLSFRDISTEVDTGLIGESAPLQKLRAQLSQFAPSPFPVLIEGESGSGKELAAAALHRLSGRAAKPYLALNCAAISPSLVEATLFGHSKGAFTGASGPRAGYFQDASDGTLFLDEIGELPLELQPKLLRVLENGEFQRIGETSARRSSARIVAATNRDLKKDVREGRFRADLYHRLSVFTIAIPALRELGDDCLRLLEHFQAIYAAQANLAPFRLSATAAERLLAYEFPGNVRELRNIAIRLTTKFAGKQVNADDLEAELDLGNTLPEGAVLAAPTSASRAQLVAIALADLQSRRDFNLDATLQLWEASYIEAARQIAHDNMSQAARLLGINRTTLYNRIDTLERARSAPPRSERPD